MKSTFVISAAVLALAAPTTVLAAEPGWTTPRTLSGSTTSGEDPQVAVGANGSAVVVWEQVGTRGERIVAASRTTDGTWGGPESISVRSTHPVSGQQVAQAAGTAVVVWQSSGRIQASLRPPAGAWTAPRTLSRSGGQAAFPQLAMSPAGAVFVTWQQHLGGRDRAVLARRPVGGPWLPPRILSGSLGDVFRPQVAVDARGDATVVWERDWADGGRSAAFVVRRSAGGTWTAPLRLGPAGQPGSEPLVAMDARGDTLVAWTGRRAGHAAVQVVTRRAHRDWGDPAVVSGGTRVSAMGDVVLAASGAAVVTWHRWDGGHVRVAAATRPVGGPWKAPVTLSEPGADASYPHVAIGGGVTTVTWESTTVEGVQLAGSTWGGVLDLSSGMPGQVQQVASNASAHVVVVWKQFDGTHNRVMVTETP